MTFVTGACPRLHILEINQEVTVSLVLTREAVLCGLRRTADSSGRNAKPPECHPADYEGSTRTPVSMCKVLAVVCLVGFHSQPDCVAGVPVGMGAAQH